MLEGYIYLPEETFLHLSRDLKFYKRAAIVLSSLCGVLGYFLWDKRETTKEKAG